MESTTARVKGEEEVLAATRVWDQVEDMLRATVEVEVRRVRKSADMRWCV